MLKIKKSIMFMLVILLISSLAYAQTCPSTYESFRDFVKEKFEQNGLTATEDSIDKIVVNFAENSIKENLEGLDEEKINQIIPTEAEVAYSSYKRSNILVKAGYSQKNIYRTLMLKDVGESRVNNRVLYDEKINLDELYQLAILTGKRQEVIDDIIEQKIIKRLDNDIDENLINPDSLDVLVDYYLGEIPSSGDAIELLEIQGFDFETARFAVSRSFNIYDDFEKNNIFKDDLNNEGFVDRFYAEDFLKSISGSRFESHVTRGIWLINEIANDLITSGFTTDDVNELKAMYLVHDIGKLGPPGVSPSIKEKSIKIFEAKNIIADQTIGNVLERTFEDEPEIFIKSVNEHLTRKRRLRVNEKMDNFFPRHSRWGEMRLEILLNQEKVAEPIAKQAWAHHPDNYQYLEPKYTILPVIDFYEASTGRINELSSNELLPHTEAMKKLRRDFENSKSKFNDDGSWDFAEMYIEMVDMIMKIPQVEIGQETLTQND